MTRPPYNAARRVFWIVDNCSAHRGARAVQRLQRAYPQLVLVHAPVHASWLNQVEIYFSIVQRKVLTPNDFPNLDSVAERLLDFQYYWESAAKPFEGLAILANFRRNRQPAEVPFQCFLGLAKFGNIANSRKGHFLRKLANIASPSDSSCRNGANQG
jgi:hypothetical protein